MGFDMKDAIRAVLGGDIDKMTDQQFAEAIGRVKAERGKIRPQKLTPQDLQGVPLKRWGDDPYMVKLVRFIPRPGAQPCPICSQLIGKYAYFLDADFFLSKAEKDHAAPFCLTVEPATAWPGSLQLPDRLQDAEGNTLDGMDLNKVNDAIYYREHPSLTDGDGRAISLNKGDFMAGKYAGSNPWELLSAVSKTAEDAGEGDDISWLIQAIDQAITGGLYGSALPRAERLRGDIFLRCGNKAAALAAYQNAIRLSPGIGLKRKVAALEKELEAQDASV